VPTRADGSSDLPGLLRAFVDELRTHNYSKALQDSAERVLPRLFEHLAKHRVRDVRAATAEHLLDFAHQLTKAPTARGTEIASATLNSYLNMVRRFFAHLEKRGTILHNPAAHLPTRRIRSLPRNVINEKQAHKLMGAPNPLTLVGKRDIALLETLYGTAIRLSECARLDASDLDLKTGTLLVRNGKGKKDRIVPVTKRAKLALRAYLRDVRPDLVRDPKEQALFLGTHSRSGERLSMATISLLVKAYGQDVGVRLSPHGLRHACATHLLNGGADIRHVQRILGHRNIRDTARYAHVAIKDLREKLDRIHPREHGRRPRRNPRKKA